MKHGGSEGRIAEAKRGGQLRESGDVERVKPELSGFKPNRDNKVVSLGWGGKEKSTKPPWTTNGRREKHTPKKLGAEWATFQNTRREPPGEQGRWLKDIHNPTCSEKALGRYSKNEKGIRV